MAATTIAEAQALIAGISCDLCKIPQGMVWQAVLAAILDINNGGSVPDAQTLITEANCLNCVVPPGMVPYLILQALRDGGIGGGGGAGGLAGAGSPEGSQAASPGATYYNSSDGSFWVKASGTGTTGWQQLIA